MDRYSELLVFTRAVAEGDFSAAARSLSLTPSAVSKLVSRLENRLGVRLFSRSSRRMALTPEGEKFYSAALRAIDAVEEADTAVAPNNLHGDTLRIRSAPTFAASQLAPLIPAFRKQHPSLRIEVHFRDADVAIYVGHLADSSLVARPFARTRWIICGVTCSSSPRSACGTENVAMVRKPGNALCLDCHGPNAQAGPHAPTIEAHTHHQPGSAGNECIACHMPKIAQTIADQNVRSHTFHFRNARRHQRRNAEDSKCLQCLPY